MSLTSCKSVPPQLGEFPLDQRVNYAYGMVMGVDDFRQEQVYHLERRRLHSRALHGYGIAWGLRVLQDPGTDVIRVLPGLAVDPLGREIEVMDAQCVRLDEWLKANGETVSGSVADGKLRLCVTLEYVECLERLVPVAGVPCADDEENQAYSRIRESFALRLALPKPPAPEGGAPLAVGEHATRALGEIMERVDVDDTPGATSDLPRILELVGAIGKQPPAGVTPLGPDEVLRIRPERLQEDLRQVMDVWTADVRPRFMEEVDERVNLGCLTFAVQQNAAGLWAHTGAITIDPDVRPVLLNTRVLQEMLLAGSRSGLQDSFEWASVYADEQNVIRVRLNYPEDLKLAGNYEVADAAALSGRPFREQLAALAKAKVPLAVILDDRVVPRFEVSAGGPNEFVLDLGEAFPIEEDDWIRVCFNAAVLKVPSTGEPLLRHVEREGVNWVSRWDQWVFAHGAFSGMTPSRRFLSFRALDERTLELWFHTLPITQPPLGLAVNGKTIPAADYTVTASAAGFGTLFILKLNTGTFADGDRLEFTFDTSKIKVQGPGGTTPTLRKWINDTETAFVGWDGSKLIKVYDHIHIERPPVAPPSRVFAQVCLLNPWRLRLWLFEPRLVLHGMHSTAPSLEVLINGHKIIYELGEGTGAANIFDLMILRVEREGAPFFTEAELYDATIEIHFFTDHISRRLAEEQVTLTERLASVDYRYLGHDPDKRVIMLRRLHCCCRARVCHFVSPQTLDPKRLRLWFHTDLPLRLGGVIAERRGKPFEVRFRPLGRNGEEPPAGADLVSSHYWLAELASDADPPLEPNEAVTFRFPVDEIMHGEERLDLYMLREHVAFICHDGEKYIRAYHTVHLPPRIEEEPPPVLDETGIRTHLVDILREEPTLVRPLVDAAVNEVVPTIVDTAVVTRIDTVLPARITAAINESVPTAVLTAVNTTLPERVTTAVNSTVPSAVTAAVNSAVPTAVNTAFSTSGRELVLKVLAEEAEKLTPATFPLALIRSHDKGFTVRLVPNPFDPALAVERPELVVRSDELGVLRPGEGLLGEAVPTARNTFELAVDAQHLLELRGQLFQFDFDLVRTLAAGRPLSELARAAGFRYQGEYKSRTRAITFFQLG